MPTIKLSSNGCSGHLGANHSRILHSYIESPKDTSDDPKMLKNLGIPKKVPIEKIPEQDPLTNNKMLWISLQIYR